LGERMPVALEPLFRLGWSLRRIQRVMVAGYEAMHTIRKGQNPMASQGMLSVMSNSSSGSSAWPPDHRSRRFNLRPSALLARQIRFRGIKCLLSSHIVGSKVKGFGPQVFVCQPRHVDERRLDRWRRGCSRRTPIPLALRLGRRDSPGVEKGSFPRPVGKFQVRCLQPAIPLVRRVHQGRQDACRQQSAFDRISCPASQI
jgi:hypothetical protein